MGKELTPAKAKKYADMRMRNRCPEAYRKMKLEDRREHMAFMNMGLYFYNQSKAITLERYVTAMYGCGTSWAQLEAVSIYYNVEHKT